MAGVAACWAMIVFFNQGGVVAVPFSTQALCHNAVQHVERRFDEPHDWQGFSGTKAKAVCVNTCRE